MNPRHLQLSCLLLLSSCLLLLSSCTLLPQPAVEPPLEQMPPHFPLQSYLHPEGGILHGIRSSELLIRTYRSGWLRFLAHNHVISTAEVRGLAHTGGDTADHADLFLRPFDLILDDAQVRSAAGAAFKSPRSPRDIAATRTRMLGPDGLDSNAYPFIQAHIQPNPAWSSAQVRLFFLGNTYAHVVPIRRTIIDDLWRIEAAWTVRQSQLGLRPYRALGGAIGVADEIEIEVRIDVAPITTLPAWTGAAPGP